MPKPARAADVDEETAEETGAEAPPAPANWEVIYLATSALMLATGIVLVLYTAGTHYGAGPFAKP